MNGKVRQMTFFWIIALVGVALLIIATTYLVVVNWSEEMYPRLVSAFGVGAVTLLVAVLATLKGSHQDMKFTTTVIFDETTHRVPIPIPSAQGLTTTFERMSSLGWAAAEEKDTPQNLDEAFSYCGELLQHKLLKDLSDIQRQGTSVIARVGSPNMEVHPGSLIIAVPDRVEIPPSQFAGYDSNRFSKTQWAVSMWKIFGGIRAPLGTSVILQRKTGPTQFGIRIMKKGYFTFDITIDPVSGGPSRPAGMTILGNTTYYIYPEGITILSKNLTTYIYDVSMSAQFEKMTAGNWRTEHYKRWIAWLMSELAKRNRID